MGNEAWLAYCSEGERKVLAWFGLPFRFHLDLPGFFRSGYRLDLVMSTRVIRLRYAETCARCGQALSAGTRAWWDSDALSTTCQACADQASAVPSGETIEVQNVGVETVPEAEVPRANAA